MLYAHRPELPRPDGSHFTTLKSRKISTPEFSFFFWAEVILLLACPVSHTYVNYPVQEKKKLSNLLQTKEVEISQFSVFLGNGYLQHAIYDWRGYHGLRSRTYLIPAGYNLKDAVAFAYGESSLYENRLRPVRKDKNFIKM